METTIMGLYRDNGKENGNYYNGGYIGIMENKMETTIMGLYRDYTGIVEKEMETTIMGLYRD